MQMVSIHYLSRLETNEDEETMIIQNISKIKEMIYMQAMMVCGGFGMEIWNIVKLER